MLPKAPQEVEDGHMMATEYVPEIQQSLELSRVKGLGLWQWRSSTEGIIL